MRKSFISACLFSLLLATHFATSEVLILSPSTPVAEDIASRIADKLNSSTVIAEKLDTKPDLIIALGHSSFRDAIANSNVPVIGTFLTSLDAPPTNRESTFAVFADPSPKDIATHLINLFPNSTIGYVYTEEEQGQVLKIQEYLQGSGTNLAPIPFSGNTFDSIRQAIGFGIDAMLITKNRAIYQSDNIRFVLESLFRKHVPVITTADTLLPAGAAIAITAEEKAVIETTANVANKIIKGEEPAQTPTIWVTRVKVNINPSLSDYFGIKTERIAK